jgi:hypothetical protein
MYLFAWLSYALYSKFCSTIEENLKIATFTSSLPALWQASCGQG